MDCTESSPYCDVVFKKIELVTVVDGKEIERKDLTSKKTQEHYIKKFKVYLCWWHKRGYSQGIPDEAPYILEAKKIVPSWRRICKCLLRNDWWCKGLCFTQPKSEAYGRYLQMKEHRKEIE